MFTIFSVFNILIAAAMIVLILMQRGAGADAGSSFGGGASGTVFGARGSATFLSRATAVLAGLFFLLSLAMGMYLGHTRHKGPDQSLGVMAGVAAQAATASTAAKAPSSDVPVAVPTAPAASASSAKPAAADVPAAQPAKASTAAAASGQK
ncbi:MAG TPA: preprotein translocase subunit SecG [Rhodanobacteraceae bacterium]|nr:preprotein translocase subunit SecG [Rhodanobacteraceae bacterium]